MRVLQIVHGLDTVGGVESYVRRLAEELELERHATLVLTTRAAPSAHSGFGVEVIPALLDREDTGAFDAACAHLLRTAARFAPDLILAHNTSHPALLSFANSHYPTAEVLHSFLCEGSKLFRRGDRLCTHPLGARCLWDWYTNACGFGPSLPAAVRSIQNGRRLVETHRELAGVVVGSEFMRRYVVAEGVREDSVFVADFRASIQPVPPVRAAATDASRLLFVGRLTYNKGVQYALRALAQLPEHFTLTVVGDGWYRPQLERLASELRLGERARFAGTLRDEALDEAYRESAALLVPSIWPEPVGLVVPEARAHGLPVVAFDAGGLAEWQGEYERVFLAPRADVAALARVVREAAAGTHVSRTITAAPRPGILTVLGALIARGRRNEADPTRVAPSGAAPRTFLPIADQGSASSIRSPGASAGRV